MKKYLIIFLAGFLIIIFPQEKIIKIGSKKFTENVILGEIITQLINADNGHAKHLREIGGTRVLWNALLSGDIDAYPEYTGTIKNEILSSQNIFNDKELKKYLNSIGVEISKPIGFNNTYAIGMKKEKAENLGIKKISDLNVHPNLSLGFSNEFLNRGDGWPGLKQNYNLPQSATGLDHDLAYRGLQSGSIDVIDLYSTDAEIKYYDLKILEDDRNYFPDYSAVILYRKNIEKKSINSFLKIEENIPETLIIAMNASVKLEGKSEGETASKFISDKFLIKTEFKTTGLLNRLWFNTKEHLFLVLISLSASILFAIPLGIAAFKISKLSGLILGFTGILQTIPSLALLVFMIPLLGIGPWPAIMALFLYSLLPIVRNTYAGLVGIPKHIMESAEVLGIPSSARLRLIELPIASRSILAGIKTSAVINVGTATLGALIGAGGYGQPILTGIRLDSIPLILEGAVPAALLALLVQGLFDLIEVTFVSRGLRLK